ncbi:hypothetical protein DYB38_011154 [Aphanomyces astaci]|uniref:Uncharacterized protein n=1 Tax=Aphanomyces astaci TaxID=112090 RepID=A0A397CKQ7_APHAT|nr:hypothetical protein DYB38_011154 [Aphanomyces astaci]
MSFIALTTADIHATSVAATTQQCRHDDPIRVGMLAVVPDSTSIAFERAPRRANAAATAGKKLVETLRPFSDNVWPFVTLFVLAMSTQVIVACMVALDYRFRGFVAVETSPVSLVCIALLSARTSFDMSTFNGDATPLHTLFKPIPDQTNLADFVWMVLSKCLVLRLASLSFEAVVGLILVLQSMYHPCTPNRLTTAGHAITVTPRLPSKILFQLPSSPLTSLRAMKSRKLLMFDQNAETVLRIGETFLALYFANGRNILSLYTNEIYCPTRIETDAYTIIQAKLQVKKIRNDANYSTDGYAGDTLEQRLATVKRLEQDFTRKFLGKYIAESLAALRPHANAFLFNSLTPILQQVIGSYTSPFSLFAELKTSSTIRLSSPFGTHPSTKAPNQTGLHPKARPPPIPLIKDNLQLKDYQANPTLHTLTTHFPFHIGFTWDTVCLKVYFPNHSNPFPLEPALYPQLSKEWIIDSGAAASCTPHRRYFIDSAFVDKSFTLAVGDGGQIPLLGYGSIDLGVTTHSGETSANLTAHHEPICLPFALHCPA